MMPAPMQPPYTGPFEPDYLICPQQSPQTSAVAKAIGTPPRLVQPTHPGLLRSQDHLAKAVLAQSKALTALVSQIASQASDPMLERGTGSFGGGSRGAQAELAGQKKGVFFQSVLIAMSRRMQPTAPAEGSPEEMMTRGISSTGYLERFGGFEQHRELGCLMHQIMTIMDFLQVGNLPAARDATALLTVTFRPSKPPALARGTPSHGVLPQACQSPCEDKGIHSVGFPTVGDRCTCVYKGAGCHICKAFGAHKPDQAKPLPHPPIRQSPSRLPKRREKEEERRMLQPTQGSQKTNSGIR